MYYSILIVLGSLCMPILSGDTAYYKKIIQDIAGKKQEIQKSISLEEAAWKKTSRINAQQRTLETSLTQATSKRNTIATRVGVVGEKIKTTSKRNIDLKKSVEQLDERIKKNPKKHPEKYIAGLREQRDSEQAEIARNESLLKQLNTTREQLIPSLTEAETHLHSLEKEDAHLTQERLTARREAEKYNQDLMRIRNEESALNMKRLDAASRIASRDPKVIRAIESPANTAPKPSTLEKLRESSKKWYDLFRSKIPKPQAQTQLMLTPQNKSVSTPPATQGWFSTRFTTFKNWLTKERAPQQLEPLVLH